MTNLTPITQISINTTQVGRKELFKGVLRHHTSTLFRLDTLLTTLMYYQIKPPVSLDELHTAIYSETDLQILDYIANNEHKMGGGLSRHSAPEIICRLSEEGPQSRVFVVRLKESNDNNTRVWPSERQSWLTAITKAQHWQALGFFETEAHAKLLDFAIRRKKFETAIRYAHSTLKVLMNRCRTLRQVYGIWPMVKAFGPADDNLHESKLSLKWDEYPHELLSGAGRLLVEDATLTGRQKSQRWNAEEHLPEYFRPSTLKLYDELIASALLVEKVADTASPEWLYSSTAVVA